MYRSWISGVVVAVLLVAVPALAAQGPIVDIKDLRPRETRSMVFRVTSPQDLRVMAVGTESDPHRDSYSWITAMWNGSKERPKEPWIGNAWILDLSTRRVVWELSAATTTRGPRGTRIFSGPVHLPAGTYEAFYAAYPSMWMSDDNGDANAAERFVNWLNDAGFDTFRIKIDGSAQTLTGADADRARRAFAADAIVDLRGSGKERFLQAGFALDRPTTIEWYAEGELRENAEYDSGWIINADTREPVWKLTWRTSAPAGGAEKNRFARMSRTLPPGRYAAIYATDDTHDPGAWNQAPPHDPDAWGLLLRVSDPAARAAVKTFAYEHVPAGAVIVDLTRVGNGESRARGFTLRRAMDVRVYAIGEGRDDRMYDYGWISSASTHARVWEMRYAETDHAGGDPKNRLVDRTLHLDKGDYIVHYVSDGSHSYHDWNASAPADAQHWGITVLATSDSVDKSAVAEYVEKPDASIIAQTVRVRDDEDTQKRFALDRETDIRILALGEGSGRSLVDYGWIEDAKGRRVWEMTYRTTAPAGGAAKNRRFEGTIKLPAGEYVLRYETDDSHAFGSWNAAPPDEPELYGITLYRVR